MVTISFDEDGSFENFEKESKGRMPLIAGFLFDEQDHIGETERELSRIQSYLKSICKDAGAEYPASLHTGEKKARNRGVMNILADTLQEFIAKGTYAGKKLIRASRHGKYYPFAMVKGKNGKRDLLGEDVSELVRDDYLSNLYLHMVEETVEHCVFYNPLLADIKEIAFDLPTRVYTDKSRDKELKRQYDKIGVDSADKKNGRIFYLTGDAVYRTSIEKGMVVSGRTDIKVRRLDVRQILYEGEALDETAARTYGFLYLSDILCWILSKSGQRSASLEQIQNRLKKIESEKSMFFIYDEVDSFYLRAVRAIQKNDYFTALSAIYDGRHFKGDYASDYDRWFSFLLRKMQKKEAYEPYRRAIMELQQYAYSNNVEQRRFLFLCRKLEAMKNTVHFRDDADKVVLAELYDCAASAYNHWAKSTQADRYLKQLHEYEPYWSIERYLSVRNKRIVSLCDQLRFDEARAEAEHMDALWEQVMALRGKVFQDLRISRSQRKMWSQLGQSMAFCRDRRAEALFLRALQEAGDTPDTWQTMSYLLHYYADNGEKSRFDDLMVRYAGGNAAFDSQLFWLIETGKGRNSLFLLKFALFAYFRGICIFHAEEIDTLLAEKIYHIEELFAERGVADSMLQGHPWELSWKYIAILALKRQEDNVADMMMRKAEAVIKKELGQNTAGALLQAIVHFGRVEYEAAKERPDTDIIEASAAACWNAVDKVYPELGEEYVKRNARTSESLRGIMTYMYH